jgi:putative intracellular protease/amidase
LIPFAAMLAVALASAVGGSLLPMPFEMPPAEQPKPRNCAILLFQNVQVIDFTGPYEVLGQAFDGKMPVFNVYTVAETTAPLTAGRTLTVTPQYSIADCPKPDVLVVPGGGVENAIKSPKVMAWVEQQARDCEIVLSVCNGAFVLGKAGLLDGLTVTTYNGLIDDLQKEVPKCTVVRDRRFVDNGKIITSAGLSAGIDGALHVIERCAGRGVAKSTALGIEYNWQPDAGYARASFADRYLLRAMRPGGFDIPDDVGWKIVSQDGDAAWWEKRWEVRTSRPPAEILRVVDAKLAGAWTRDGGSPTSSAWRFTGDDGRAWTAGSRIEPLGDEAGAYLLSIRLSRR